MFGKKNEQKKEEITLDPKATFSSMPDIFYGGKDPEIYHTQTKSGKAHSGERILEDEKEKKKPVDVAPPAPARPQIAQKPLLAKAPTQIPPVASQQTPPKTARSRIFTFSILGLVIILVALGTWVALTYVKKPQTTQAPPPPPTIADGQQDPALVPPALQEDVPPVQEDSLLPAAQPDELIIARIFASQSGDLDEDSLTDEEEEVFGTDSGSWDTDADGYFDGQEVRNLYSPRGFAPTKLIDSALVREFVHPEFGYRVYYPVSWTADMVDEQGKEVLISTITGEYIDIQTFEKEPGESFVDWFARVVTGERFSDYVPEKNRFMLDGYIRRDRLVGMHETQTHVFVLAYVVGPQTSLLYPHVMELMLQSFRPTNTQTQIPEQVVLPGTQPLETDITLDAPTSTQAESDGSPNTDTEGSSANASSTVDTQFDVTQPDAFL